MSEHTRGPWIVDGHNIYGPPDARSRHRNGRTLVGGVVDEFRDWRASLSESGDERSAFAAETEANARLIAAAPDLLAACRLACRTLEVAVAAGCDDVATRAHALEHHVDLKRLRAAIAKAEGRL